MGLSGLACSLSREQKCKNTCTLPALTDSIPERKRGELAGEVTRELQVVGKAASIAILTWVRNNDKTKARAEEREKNIGWIKRLFTAWRVSHARAGARARDGLWEKS